MKCLTHLNKPNGCRKYERKSRISFDLVGKIIFFDHHDDKNNTLKNFEKKKEENNSKAKTKKEETKKNSKDTRNMILSFILSQFPGGVFVWLGVGSRRDPRENNVGRRLEGGWKEKRENRESVKKKK